MSACDVPTALPKWDTNFVIQSENTTIAAAQLLPASITITNNTFAISVSPMVFSQDLGGLCLTCATLNDQNAPRPAFLGSFSSSIALPADVAGAMLMSGRLNIAVQNGFSFDPLRAGDQAGTVTITVTSGPNVIGTKVLTGATDTLPPGGSLMAPVAVNGVVEGGLDVAVEVRSPAGESTQIDTGEKLNITATPSSLRASSARLRVHGRHVNAKPIRLNLASLSSTIINNATSGAIVLSISNPLGVSGPLVLRIAGGPRTIAKPVTIATGDSNVEVSFDKSELKAFLGHDVYMTIDGTVSAPGNVALTPEQAVTVSSRLKLTIGPDD